MLNIDAGPEPLFFLNAEQRGGTADNGKPSKTIDEAGFHLIGGEPGWSNALGAPATVTYAFRSTAPAAMPEDTSGFSRFNAAQINQAELALQAWSDVANITFVRVGSGSSGSQAYSNSASILFANYSSGEAGAAAFSNFPGDYSFGSASGDVWVNNSLSYNANPSRGNYGGLVLVHEIGHAIGLAHPGDYNAGDGVDITYSHDAEYYEDSLQYTVMSYFDETETGAMFKGAYSATPLLDDISAAQQEYGANLNTRVGDTVYGFNATAGRSWFSAISSASTLIFAVWDAGGIDTFDFSGFGQNQIIDLKAGHFSNVGGLIGNVAIAQNVDIENAIGGTGVDSIVGNALANRLLGAAGDDWLDGGAGDDWLDGGAGLDTVGFDLSAVSILASLEVGKAWNNGTDALVSIENLSGSAYDDILIGDLNANALRGQTGADTINGLGGADTIDGGAGADTLYGADGADTLLGGEGGDVLDGGAGDDLMVGGAGGDVLVGRDGDDVINGEADADTLIGEAGNDTLYGGSGDDFLAGGDGDDAMIGGDGADTVYGGAGADALVGGDGADLLSGEDGDDMVVGGAGGDLLVGGAGNDLLRGDDGDDILVGDGGGDTLIGGAGGDLFLFRSTLDSSPAGGIDLISDFQRGVDAIDLSQIDAVAGGTANEAFTFVDAFSGAAGQATLTYLAASDRTIFQGDVNGDGIADFVLAVNGHLATTDGWLL